MYTLRHSLRFALRLFVKSPSFTLIAVLALALGIGSVTTMFSVINGALIRGLPFEDPHQLVQVKRWDTERHPWQTEIPVMDLQDIQANQSSFTAMAGWFSGTVNLNFANNPLRFNGSRISHSWLDVLQVQPFIGRNFTAQEDAPGAPPVLLLSHATWRAHFNADPAIIGQSVHVNGRSGTIIGVMPKGFAFPMEDEVWIPLSSSLNWNDLQRGDWGLNVMARLKSGVSVDQASAEMTRFIQQFATEYPDISGNFIAGTAEPLAAGLLGPQTIRMLWIMLAMGVFVLLIACANVANLLLARSTLRSKELAIRGALGANRRSLIAQLLIESVTLSVIGAIAGLLLSLWATQALYDYAQVMNSPYWLRFDIDWRVLCIVSLVTLLAGILAGIVPALRASRVSISDILKDDTRTGSSLKLGLFSKGMVIVQVAISSVLLILTVLMMRSVQTINDTDLHFDTDSVFTARMGLFEGDYPSNAERYQFFSTLERNLAEHPDLQSVALYSRYRWGNTGLNWSRVTTDAMADSEFESLPLTTQETITAGYFETLGVELIAGRAFNAFDTSENRQVAIINQAMATALFPDQDPLGQRFRRALWPPERANLTDSEIAERTEWLTVIGIAPDMAAQGVGNTTDAAGRHYWLPLHAGNAPPFMTIVAAPARGAPLSLAPVIRSEVQALDPNLPLYAVATPSTLIHEDTAGNRVIANIFKFFGLMAVFLASVGIYGIMSFAVNQRTMEFGIRSALGATQNSILLLVMRSGLLQFKFGLVLGLILAFLFARLLRTFLYGVSVQDPLTYLSVATIFTVVALSACLLPARRAAAIHPAQALRHD